jgi:hypothetical protein
VSLIFHEKSEMVVNLSHLVLESFKFSKIEIYNSSGDRD